LEIESGWQLIPFVEIGRKEWIHDEGRLDVLNSATSMAVMVFRNAPVMSHFI
jgi:hypothetical protein